LCSTLFAVVLFFFFFFLIFSPFSFHFIFLFFTPPYILVATPSVFYKTSWASNGYGVLVGGLFLLPPDRDVASPSFLFLLFRYFLPIFPFFFGFVFCVIDLAAASAAD
jgi:hypothetical protein